MADTFVQVPPDGAGKKLAAVSWTQGADTVHGEKFLICDASGNVVAVKNVAPAGTDYALVTRNIPSGTQAVDGSGVTQPVAGTFWQATQPVSAVSLPLPTGAAQEHVTAASPHAVRLSDGATFIIAASQADVQAVRDRLPAALDADGGLKAHIQNFPATQPVSGTVTATGPLTDTQLRATPVPVSGTFWQATQPVSLATNTPDTVDRAAREVGRVRIWDGTDEATITPLRTAPASTEKAVVVREIPNRLATFSTTIATQTPAITIGVKEMLALWHASTATKDIYIVELWVTGLVTTASTTGGRTTVRVSTITAAPTGGTALTPVDPAGGTSDMTNTMQAKTGGGTIGTTFLRKIVWHATQAIGSAFQQSIFQASNPGNGIILPQGSNGGVSIDIEREVAHTALVDVWTVGARWLEI